MTGPFFHSTAFICLHLPLKSSDPSRMPPALEGRTRHTYPPIATSTQHCSIARKHTLVTPVIMFSTSDLTVRKHATCLRAPCQMVKTTLSALAVLTCTASVLVVRILCVSCASPALPRPDLHRRIHCDRHGWKCRCTPVPRVAANAITRSETRLDAAPAVFIPPVNHRPPVHLVPVRHLLTAPHACPDHTPATSQRYCASSDSPFPATLVILLHPPDSSLILQILPSPSLSPSPNLSRSADRSL